MLIPFGVLSAAGAGGGVAGDYELIASEILGSTQASITFSNLGDYSSTYKHLQIRYAARGNGSSTGTLLRFNGDTGNNYARHLLYASGSGGVVSSLNGTSTSGAWAGSVFGTGATANAFAAAVVDVLDVYATKNKTIRTLEARPNEWVALNSGLWMNTASVTSITLLPDGASFIAGSRFSLYGIKG
jgi:hypothetical protein